MRLCVGSLPIVRLTRVKSDVTSHHRTAEVKDKVKSVVVNSAGVHSDNVLLSICIRIPEL